MANFYQTNLTQSIISFVIAASVFFYEPYEGETQDYDYGTRTSEVEPECGRKVLKITDSHHRIFVGGKTKKTDGSETPDYFNAHNFGQVSSNKETFLTKTVNFKVGIELTTLTFLLHHYFLLLYCLY